MLPNMTGLIYTYSNFNEFIIMADDFSGPARVCLGFVYTSDSATNTTMRKSKELSINLKEGNFDLNKSGKSLGALPKQLQVPRSTMQTTVYGTDVTRNANHHLLLRENLSGWSRVN